MPKTEKRKVPPFVAFPKTLYDDVNAGRWTANQLKVVLVVVRYTVGHMGQSEGAYLSQRTIAEKAQLHERNVRGVLDDLTTQGVIRVIETKRPRRAAKIAMQTDAARWGTHSPDAPPLRSAPGNAGKLRPSQFAEDNCGHGCPQDNGADEASICGHGCPPSAGMDAQSICGQSCADSEDAEDVFLNALDSGSTGEPPLSAPTQGSTPEERAEVQERNRRHLEDIRRQRAMAAIRHGLGEESAA